MKLIDLNEKQYKTIKKLCCNAWNCSECPFKGINDVSCVFLKNYEEFSIMTKTLTKETNVEALEKLAKDLETLRTNFQGENNEDN